ncbi:MAG: lysozyme [Magnetococcales bacterium]|nr:lysozyme [Magnetococcales bacterium]
MLDQIDITIGDPSQLIAQLKKHEGVRLKPYKCSAGKLTIGVGRNIEDIGITDAESDFFLANDINRVISELRGVFASFDEMDDVRKSVLVDMCFNLGISRFLKFKNMLSAVRVSDWQTASEEMLDSKWAKQVGVRATRLSQMMLTGEV